MDREKTNLQTIRTSAAEMRGRLSEMKDEQARLAKILENLPKKADELREIQLQLESKTFEHQKVSASVAELAARQSALKTDIRQLETGKSSAEDAEKSARSAQRLAEGARKKVENELQQVENKIGEKNLHLMSLQKQIEILERKLPENTKPN